MIFVRFVYICGMKRSTLLLLLAFSLIAVACPMVDPDDPKPTPGPTPTTDSTTVSLSTTRKITASDLVSLSLAERLSLSADGTYALSSEGSPVAMSFDGLKDYDGSRPFRKYCNFPISYDFRLGNKPSVPTGAGYGEIDLSSVLPATVNLGSRSKGTTLYAPALPDGLASVESITLSEKSQIRITLSIPDCFFTDGTVTPSFSVDMRQFFESDETVDGILTFDAPLTKENGWAYTKNLRLTGVIFDPANFDASTNKLKIDARIGLSGKVAFEGMKTTRARLSAAEDLMKLNVTVVLLDVSCESITGSFSYKTKDMSGTLDLHDLANAAGKTLDAKHAEIQLDLSGNLPVESGATVALTTKRSRRTLGKAEGIQLEMPAASEAQASSASRTLTSADAGVAALLTEMPDELLVSSSAFTNPESTGTMWIGQSYAASITPSVRIPLAFNKNLSVEVSDTLTAPSQLKAALKKGPASLSGQVSNSLPYPATMTVRMIDEYGMAVTTETSMDVPAGATTNVSMTVKNAAGEGIDGLSRTVVTFKVTGVDGSRPLKSTDALQADLKVKFLN